MIRQKNVLLLLGRGLPKFFAGVTDYAGQHRWHLETDLTGAAAVPDGWIGDGAIVALDESAGLARIGQPAAMPVVAALAPHSGIDLPRIGSDDEIIGRLAAEHFLEHNVRHFAWYSRGFGDTERSRYTAFCETLARRNLQAERLVWSEQATKPSGDWLSLRAWLGQTLKHLPKPLGVFTVNDQEASDVLDVCLFHSLLVPEAVAILGVGNDEAVCECKAVPLSSVNDDHKRIGYEAAAMLDRLMRGKPPPKRPVFIPPRGVTTRQSTDMLAVDHPGVRKAIKFLRENFHVNISTNDVAEAAQISRRGLEKAFREHMNRSVREEITRLRLQRVKELLLSTKLSVIDIAARTGFAHAQHLNNKFRKTTAVTPIRFRHNHQPKNLARK